MLFQTHSNRPMDGKIILRGGVLTNLRHSAYNAERVVSSRCRVAIGCWGEGHLFGVVGCSTLSYVDARGRTDFCL